MIAFVAIGGSLTWLTNGINAVVCGEWDASSITLDSALLKSGVTLHDTMCSGEHEVIMIKAFADTLLVSSICVTPVLDECILRIDLSSVVSCN